jgi:hypothetical protein
MLMAVMRDNDISTYMSLTMIPPDLEGPTITWSYRITVARASGYWESPVIDTREAIDEDAWNVAAAQCRDLITILIAV